MSLQTRKAQGTARQTAFLATALLAAASATALHLSTREVFSASLPMTFAMILGATFGLWLTSWMIGGATKLFWREMGV